MTLSSHLTTVESTVKTSGRSASHTFMPPPPNSNRRGRGLCGPQAAPFGGGARPPANRHRGVLVGGAPLVTHGGGAGGGALLQRLRGALPPHPRVHAVRGGH
eukprot:183130-Pyramimonas_sp.AAC.1